MFRNDGTGHFTTSPTALPHFTNNYELEAMDIDGDGDLDLTINDGPNNGTAIHRAHLRQRWRRHVRGRDRDAAHGHGESRRRRRQRHRVARRRQRWRFRRAGRIARGPIAYSSTTAPATSRSRPARRPTTRTQRSGSRSRTSNEDGRLDSCKGRARSPIPDKVQLATARWSRSTRSRPSFACSRSRFTTSCARAIHDRVAPSHPHDFKSVVVKIGNDVIPMKWYGPMMWRAELPLEPSTTEYQVCATDRAGNEKCESRPMAGADAGVDAPTGTTPGDDDGGCCSSSRDARGSVLLALITLAGIRRRRSR